MSSNDVTSEVVLASLSSFGNYGMGSSVLAVIIVAVLLVGFMVWERVSSR